MDSSTLLKQRRQRRSYTYVECGARNHEPDLAPKIAARLLRAAGALLIILGIVHLVATSLIAQLLDGAQDPVYQRAVGPALLNHVLVGILLIPLGYTTWLASSIRNRTEGWARRVLVVNGLVMLTLPISIAMFMRQPEYYHAPLFVTGVSLVAIVSLLMVGAACVLLRE